MNLFNAHDVFFLVAGVSGGAYLVCMLLHLRRRRVETVQQQVERAATLKLLQQAADHNCRMNVRFESTTHAQPGEDWEGSCLQLDAEKLVLVLSRGRLGPVWVGRKVRVYYQLALADGKRDFFDFVSTVQRVFEKGRQAGAVLTVPQRMTQGQRRQFVRFIPQVAHIVALNLFRAARCRESTNTAQLAAVREQTATASSNAQIRWESIPKPQYALQDISAGGLQFTLPECTHTDPVLKVGEDVYVHLALEESHQRKVLELVLAGTVVRLGSQQEFVGIEFTHWGQRPDPRKGYVWRGIRSNDGVPPLAVWIMRRHSEIHHI